MIFSKVFGVNNENFKKAWDIYNVSFPSDEKRNLKQQKQIFKKPEYFFHIFLYNNSVGGLITFWTFKDFIFIEHLAIKKNLRGKGLGTQFLKKFLSEFNLKVVLEVEKPLEDIQTKKRILFYENLGFKLNKKFDYIQPSYEKGKHPVSLFIMSYPLSLNFLDFSKIREKIHRQVYETEPILSI